MGKASRDKGARNERAFVNLLRAVTLEAERVPLSGGAGGSFSGDIRVDFGQGIKTLEAKVRAGGFKQIYDWLAGNYGLIIKADRMEPLIVLRLSEAAKLAAQLREKSDDSDESRLGG